MYFKLLKFLFKRWEKFILAVICMGIEAAATGAIAFLVKPALDDIFISKNVVMLKFLPLVIILTYIMKGLGGFGEVYLMEYIAQDIVYELRNKFYSKLHELSLDFFTKIHTGEIISRITVDINMIREAITKGFASLIRDSLTVLVLLGVIFYRQWLLSLLTLFIFPLSVIPIVKLGKRFKKISKKNQERIAELVSLICEVISGIRIVKAFCMEEFEKKRFLKKNKKLFKIILKGYKVNALSSPMVEVFGAISGACVIWIWGYQVIKGNLSTGTFFSFLTAVFMLYKPLKNLSKVNNLIQQAVASSERIFPIINMKPSVVEKENAITLPPVKREIRFKDVYFAYESNSYILKGINFKINIGEIVAIVGKSGVGKTTLVNLIPRFYDPTRGDIFIDDYNIKDVTLKSLREQIGIVTQETILFNDTVFNNIAYGREDISEDEVIKAAKAANAHDFIINLPDGYNTIIGERGVKLSGGQRQRIAIARAILKNPPILILDEATSELDAESEFLVQEALMRLMKGRTVFIIAHRLSTIIHADRILVLHDGRIVEDGTHESLLQQGGIYAKLYESQLI